MNLELRPQPSEVSVERQCGIKINNEVVKLRTREYYEAIELKQLSSLHGKTASQAIVIKVDEETRNKLQLLESEVKLQLPADWDYKPLYLGPYMTISVSRFCKYFAYDENGKTWRITPTASTEFHAGHYNFLIWAKHLFVGPHHGGENCSMRLEIVEMYYREDKSAERKRKDNYDTPWCQSVFRPSCE